MVWLHLHEGDVSAWRQPQSNTSHFVLQGAEHVRITVVVTRLDAATTSNLSENIPGNDIVVGIAACAVLTSTS